MKVDEALIVGAGPTGLVLALQLARRGARFRIIDKNSGPAQASRATGVQARTLEFYQQLGFAEDVVAAGTVAEKLHICQEGSEAATFSFRDVGTEVTPYPFLLSYPQDDHERLLVRKLKELGVEVEWETSLAEFSQAEDGVRSLLRKGTAEEVVESAYLCGCDGVHSPVREGLQIGFPGGTYEQLFYVADAQLSGPEANNDAYMNLYAGGFLVVMPVRSSGMHRLIGVAPSSRAGQQPLFDDLRPMAERVAKVKVEKVNWFSTYHVHHRVASQFRVGRCFLAGDAGHVHSPAGGQGMNTGIGDAVNLGWKLAGVLNGNLNHNVLDTYEKERLPFARTLVSTTDSAFQKITYQGAGGGLLRTFIVPHLMSLLMGFSPVKKQVFLTVSQTRVGYRASPLSEGEAGEVKAGDRLPWTGARAEDNFAPLRSLDWQVHVYGTAEESVVEICRQLKLPLHVFAWSEATERAGFERNACYLVRPDGYVGLAANARVPEMLLAYYKRFVRHRAAVN